MYVHSVHKGVGMSHKARGGGRTLGVEIQYYARRVIETPIAAQLFPLIYSLETFHVLSQGIYCTCSYGYQH